MSRTHLLILLSSALLGVGLVAPTLTIRPQAGEFSWLVEILAPEELVPSTYSIVGVIRELYLIGDVFLAGVLGLFSIVFPVFKLCLYWLGTDRSGSLVSSGSLYEWTTRASKFSMAEVFVLALVILSVKALPGGSSATMEWGAYVFVGSALGAMLVPTLARKNEP